MNAFTYKYSWPIYALFTAFSLTIFFTCNKIGSQTATPLLYGLIVHAINLLGHVYFIKRRKIQIKTAVISLPMTTIWLSILVGFAVFSNELSSIYMFKVGAPLSISIPIFTASTVFLIALFGIIILKETVSFKQVIGLISIIIGLVLINV